MLWLLDGFLMYTQFLASFASWSHHTNATHSIPQHWWSSLGFSLIFPTRTRLSSALAAQLPHRLRPLSPLRMGRDHVIIPPRLLAGSYYHPDVNISCLYRNIAAASEALPITRGDKGSCGRVIWPFAGRVFILPPTHCPPNLFLPIQYLCRLYICGFIIFGL